jgi:hypothetical protein
MTKFFNTLIAFFLISICPLPLQAQVTVNGSGISYVKPIVIKAVGAHFGWPAGSNCRRGLIMKIPDTALGAEIVISRIRASVSKTGKTEYFESIDASPPGSSHPSPTKEAHCSAGGIVLGYASFNSGNGAVMISGSQINDGKPKNIAAGYDLEYVIYKDVTSTETDHLAGNFHASFQLTIYCRRGDKVCAADAKSRAKAIETQPFPP